MPDIFRVEELQKSGEENDGRRSALQRPHGFHMFFFHTTDGEWNFGHHPVVFEAEALVPRVDWDRNG